MEHLINNNLLSASQFGFLPGQSTCTQLLTALNKWYNSYDLGINIDIVYTDISKAFDTVSHHKLLAVLESYGIVSKTLNWIHTFISDKTQCVYINNAFSSFLPVTSGVPQGSVLEPLLFIIFINNMSIFCHPKHPLSGMLLYADDAKLFSTDYIDFQRSITNINSWMDSYQLSIAPAKCQHLLIVRHSNNDGSVVEWLKHRTDDQHGLGSKSTCAILLCPWERHFTALSPAW